MKIRLIALISVFMLILNSGLSSAATPVKNGATCKTQGKIATVVKIKYKCTLTGKKLTWQKSKVTELSNIDLKPTYIPKLLITFFNNAPVENPNRITVSIYGTDQNILSNQKIDNFEFQIRKESSTEWSPSIFVNVNNYSTTDSGDKYWLAGWTILPETLGQNIYSRVRAISGTQSGDWSESKMVGTVTPTIVTPIVTPTPTPSPTPTNVYAEISQRDWQLIVKDPNGNQSRYVIIYGRITQFDSITGLGSMRAEIFGTQEELNKSYSLGDNTFLTGSNSILKNFVAKDKFRAHVMIAGTYTYTTALNAKMTVPLLTISSIELL